MFFEDPIGAPRPTETPPPTARGTGGAHDPRLAVRGALSPAGWLAAASAMILCVGAADYLTSTDVSLILFYLAPIGVGTWFASVRGGLALAAGSAVLSTAMALAWRAQHGGEPGTAVLLWNGFMLVGTALSLVLVLGALKGRLAAEELLARTDALTQIANRRAFFEAAALELERSRRHGRPLTVAYIDCDDFKTVNDRLGHAEGDALLCTIGQTLRHATRAVDAVARLGGDEFGLILPETDAAMAEALLDRLRTTLLAAVTRHGAWSVGFSVGAAVFLTPPADVDELMARADELMYTAKRDAKGSVQLAVYRGLPSAVSAAAPR